MIESVWEQSSFKQVGKVKLSKETESLNFNERLDQHNDSDYKQPYDSAPDTAYGKKFTYMNIGDHGLNSRMPNNWSLEKFDGMKWTVEKQFKDNRVWKKNETRTYMFKKIISETKFRIKITSVFDGNIFRMYGLNVKKC